MSLKLDENIKNTALHVAIIPDGNRRWATNKGLPPILGHKKGAENFEILCDAAKDLGVKCITLWGFSTENWKRTEDEVENVFNLARELIKKFSKKCIDEKIRLIHLGRKDRFPPDLTKLMNEMVEETKSFVNFIIGIAADYGGHDELIRALTKIREKGLELNDENIENYLDTSEMPQIDLIIRTGGEVRLSGFMSWQSAYAELYFTDTLFPDFGPEELKKALESFSKRDRRYGGNSTEQVNSQ
ncbi:di-trans,poly-cis-decaprenylcistransferase [candidate division WWE3 bacterium RIFCSPHIGHO2_12_FULL_38_15]|uniref:Isoprenyl transferase n=1 Tax=candidate division WWE3 bacterium RIFCSPHIGHO2_02_FULL_38_14 TaxID=1802620 RepID=A0A1F4V9U4_UNCKA|nr:MAG: di-trans,poly-cis-decaprenylcistransferase [candidate division WWE3 bacterium RIFCSPHIGHO2_01_FULL_38_45]OGC48362.1 MAG: di-trans,poly-cis-decaprenylcistransferase [candidate division WWE3 bacterium RIFCSPHIGHO2_12_FULL_38_15]OGC53660.1 MAG: di-trans,poly-cis-decaprenylcistransferase [candidate division WWE3 bacterium RIFCSPHIGHO2_02_FULL_38_14]OGC54297.1 MAG: di-trans,poly-cis-decaprenylcistransferase [candidate division WWE3 bacterium RIFCSPLOWO2_01_FULL_37_24]HLB51541.1 polyprenyl di